jgi:WhiB family transcriptional regulator, redox-sensing transcriptional regulator
VIFENSNPEVKEKYLKLVWSLDGTQPCANDDPDLWIENWTGRPIPRAIAKERCAGCPFIQQCLDYAVAADEELGIWGGTTTEERKEMRNGR